MSIWQRNSVTRNPYRRTVFRVAMMPREIVGRASIAGYLAEAKDIASVAPDSHRIQGERVTLEEIHDAETILLNPRDRVCHEMLTHATESPRLDRLRQLEKEVSSLISEFAQTDPKPKPEALLPVLLDFLRSYIDTVNPSEPWFGALEMDIVPPFGGADRE